VVGLCQHESVVGCSWTACWFFTYFVHSQWLSIILVGYWR